AIATGAGSAAVPVDALGISSALAISPAQIDFGTAHAPADAAPVSVTITNLTGDTLELRDAVRAGARPGDFTVSGIAGPLAPGASAVATVAYTAPSATISAATLDFATSDPKIPHAVVALSGVAVSTFVTVDRAAVEFGAIQVGDRSGPKTVTLTNATTGPISIASISAGDGQFVVDAPPSASGAPLAPGASVTFTVAFVPADIAPTTSHIAITLDGAASPELLVSVSGEGTANADTDAGCRTTGPTSLAPALGLLLVLRRRRR
ncbi:MAG: choice-of-anchor D domain-containing protein, partial [Deltaproteobacteria bacterium]|nr:choice-of-anchor D domain-containing protein [Deltaproteobacteria bacterium]